VTVALHGLGALVQFTQMAREAHDADYLHEVDHMGERVKRLEQAITEAVKLATPGSAGGGQGLTGFARHRGDSAVTIH